MDAARFATCPFRGYWSALSLIRIEAYPDVSSLGCDPRHENTSERQGQYLKGEEFARYIPPTVAFLALETFTRAGWVGSIQSS
jgi:hypothetical protein